MRFHYLISEDGKGVSTGRIIMWILLGYSTYFWFFKSIPEFPATLYNCFTSILLYNFGKKGIEVINTFVQEKVNPTVTPIPAPVPTPAPSGGTVVNGVTVR